MASIIQYNRGGRGGPYFVAADLSETTRRANAKVWASYDEAVAFCKSPDFKAKYGEYWGVLHADDAVREGFDRVGKAVAAVQRPGEAWLLG